MVLRKTVGTAVALFLLGTAWVWAGNGDLAKTREIPAGESVAYYLQACLTTFGTILEAKNSGGLFDGGQTCRVVAVYNPDRQGIDVTVIGTQGDPKTSQTVLENFLKVILKLNPNLKKNFGVTLQESDLSMDYLYAKNGQVLMRYREGQFLQGPPPGSEPTDTPMPVPNGL